MSQPGERVVYNILADDIERTADFYVEVAAFQRSFSSKSYITLVSDCPPVLEIGIIEGSSFVVRQDVAGRFVDGYLSLSVTDVYLAHERACSLGAEIISAPDSLEYGQVRMLLRDPNGVVLDIATPAPQSA